MRTEVDHRVGLELVLEPGVEGRECMVRCGVFCHEEAHRVSFIAEARLLADEDVAELAAEDVELPAVVEDLARRIAPERFDLFICREQAPVLLYREVGADIAVCAVDETVAFQQAVPECLNGWWDVDPIPFCLHFQQQAMKALKDIEKGCRACIAEVRREVEENDCNLLFCVR